MNRSQQAVSVPTSSVAGGAVSAAAAAAVNMATQQQAGPPPPIILSFENVSSELELPSDLDSQVNNFFVNLLQGRAGPDDMLKVVYDYATMDTPASKKLLDGILRMLSNEVSRHLLDYPTHVLTPITELYGGVLANLFNA